MQASCSSDERTESPQICLLAAGNAQCDAALRRDHRVLRLRSLACSWLKMNHVATSWNSVDSALAICGGAAVFRAFATARSQDHASVGGLVIRRPHLHDHKCLGEGNRRDRHCDESGHCQNASDDFRHQNHNPPIRRGSRRSIHGAVTIPEGAAGFEQILRFSGIARACEASGFCSLRCGLRAAHNHRAHRSRQPHPHLSRRPNRHLNPSPFGQLPLQTLHLHVSVLCWMWRAIPSARRCGLARPK